jgi:DNA-binding LacI/PurR family transcriptional regulator
VAGVKPASRRGPRPARLAALIVPDLVHPFFAELAKGLSAALAGSHSLPGWPGHYVGMDDRRIGQLATEHLIAVGCRRIAHIGGADVSTATDRWDGYRQALIQHGLPASRELTMARARAARRPPSSVSASATVATWRSG